VICLQPRREAEGLSETRTAETVSAPRPSRRTATRRAAYSRAHASTLAEGAHASSWRGC